jgi:uncharacterized protein (TIRG00374 family)
MWKRVLFGLSIVLGLAAFAAIPLIVGVKDTLDTIRRTGWTSILVFLANASLTTIIPAAGWWILMRGEGIPATLGQALKANFMGFPINLLTPSAYLGGEPLKTVYIARVCGVTKRRALATIIVAKVQEVAALVLMMLVATAIFLWRVDLGPGKEIGVTVVTAIMALFVIGMMIGFFRNARPTVRLIELVARLGIARRKMARLRTKAEEMESLIHAAFVHRWKRFLVAQAVTTVSAASIFFRPWIYFVFDSEVGLLGSEHLGAIYFITNAINTIAFTPGGIGLFEGGVVGYFTSCGLPNGDAKGAAYAIVNRISDVVFIMAGLWLIAHTGLTAVAKGIAKGTDESIKPEDLPTPADV